MPGIAAERVLLVGLGKATDFGPKEYREAVRAAVRALADGGAAEATLFLAEVKVKGRDRDWALLHGAAAAADVTYRFDQLKSKKNDSQGRSRRITLGLTGKSTRAEVAAVERGAALGAGQSLAKDLGNLPGNICTPTYLAEQAQALARSHKLRMRGAGGEGHAEARHGRAAVGDQRQRTAGQADRRCEYHGAGKKQKPVVLVGKGITFDTGGISLKPGAEMDEMKYDMCGAASVLGTMQAVAEMGLPLNVVGVIPTCENMPGGNATKPGDIVTSMSGQTIEILNTDAEGRLILCDALTYAERFEPDAVIDIATLTGACVIALGHVASGLFSNDDELAQELLAAGRAGLRPRLAHAAVGRLPGAAARATSPTWRTSAAARPAASPRPASWRASPRTTTGRTWTSPAPPGRSGKDKGSTGRPVPLLTDVPDAPGASATGKS